MWKFSHFQQGTSWQRDELGQIEMAALLTTTGPIHGSNSSPTLSLDVSKQFGEVAQKQALWRPAVMAKIGKPSKAMAALSLEDLGFSAHSSASPDGVLSGSTEKSKLIREIAGVSLGRIIGFGTLFDITG